MQPYQIQPTLYPQINPFQDQQKPIEPVQGPLDLSKEKIDSLKRI